MPIDNARPLLRPTIGARRVAFAISFAVVLLSACRNEGPGGSGEVRVRVRNDRSAAIVVSIGSANFGSVATGATSAYRVVAEQGNVVIANGVVVDTADFCEGCAGFGDNRWTYYFVEGGSGFEIDLSVRPAAARLQNAPRVATFPPARR
jgi:hypothetical protein